MTEPALRQCPLCDAAARFVPKMFKAVGERFGVTCTACDCEIDCRALSRGQAAEIWNRRPEIDPLFSALRQLARVHTGDDSQVGFKVIMGASAHPIYNGVTTGEYIDAWMSVRKFLHLQTEPAESGK